MIEFELFEAPMTIEELKRIDIERLSKTEKLRVKLRGRPTPMIQISRTASSDGKIYIRSFKEMYFHEKD